MGDMHVLKVDEVVQQNSSQGPFWVGKVAGKTYRFKSEVKPGDEVYGEVTESHYEFKGKPVTSRWVEVKSIKPPQPDHPPPLNPSSTPQTVNWASFEAPSFDQVMAAIHRMKAELGMDEVTGGIIQTVIKAMGMRGITPPVLTSDDDRFKGDAYDEGSPPPADDDAPPWARG